MTLKQRMRRWWRLESAKTKAFWVALFIDGARPYQESVWVEVPAERRRPLLPPLDFVNDDDLVQFRIKITFVGVVRGSILDGTIQLLRSYYGDPRFPIDSYQATRRTPMQ